MPGPRYYSVSRLKDSDGNPTPEPHPTAFFSVSDGKLELLTGDGGVFSRIFVEEGQMRINPAHEERYNFRPYKDQIDFDFHRGVYMQERKGQRR